MLNAVFDIDCCFVGPRFYVVILNDKVKLSRKLCFNDPRTRLSLAAGKTIPCWKQLHIWNVSAVVKHFLFQRNQWPQLCFTPYDKGPLRLRPGHWGWWCTIIEESRCDASAARRGRLLSHCPSGKGKSLLYSLAAFAHRYLNPRSLVQPWLIFFRFLRHEPLKSKGLFQGPFIQVEKERASFTALRPLLIDIWSPDPWFNHSWYEILQLPDSESLC